MIRHIESNNSESWKNLPWKKFRKDLFRLQKRVYEAVRAGDTLKAKSLQKLILNSRAARYLAIRQVTQLNDGKKTAGIDGKKSLSFKERFKLEEKLRLEAKNWKHSGLREIPIPKKDGTKRILKVPNISDRAWQCLAKYAIEPAHEATFHERSYGFRPGRSAFDAQKILFSKLSSNARGINKRIIEIDISKCFDRINHKAIMDNLIAPKHLKTGVFRCLKSGASPCFPEQGTPQGGVISPLLANIALNGIERIGEYRAHTKWTSLCIRYADDMVFVLRPQDNLEAILEEINRFLERRGLEVNQQKTKISVPTEGFDFLGWNFLVQNNGKFRSRPSVGNYMKFRKKVKQIIKRSNYSVEEKVKRLSTLVRGWRNYHKHCKMDGARNNLYYLQKQAFKVFNRGRKQNKITSKELLDRAFPKVSYSQNSHIVIKGDRSPYDGDLVYWSKRNSKFYDNYTARALKRQHYTCANCGLKMTSEERINLHHADGNHNNWEVKNLKAVHESCHDYIHMGKSES